MKFSLAVSALLGSALAIDPIVIKGSKFFYSSNDTQLYVPQTVATVITNPSAISEVLPTNDVSTDANKTYTDPLADTAACQRDIPILQELRTNTIRVYAIDPKQDHTGCMNALASADIYVISDLSDPSDSIDRSDPQWSTALYARYTAVVDEMAQYNNTLGFFAGNEVSNTVNTTAASAFVKAAVRDMKAYIKQRKAYRPIGVGYATNDDSAIRVNMADYFNCEGGNGDDDTYQGIDFWGYNVYSWCGDSSYQASGYKARTQELSNYSVPVFFAEYGCNEVQPRKFTEVDALYGDTMADVWSGGIVYMYFQEANNYGLVSVSSNSVSKLEDFTSYSKHIASANPTGTNKASYTPTNTALQSCPSVGTAWEAAASPLPPTPNTDLCTCMSSAAKCVVKDSVSSSEYSALFGVVCGYTDCSGVTANGTTGSYGAYSMCEAKDQLNFIINRYYDTQGEKSSACDFGGSATVTTAAKATSSSCKALMSQAGSAGTGTVTSLPTGTSGGDAQASSSKGAAGPGVIAGGAGFGQLQVGVYLVAGMAAFGMVLL